MGQGHPNYPLIGCNVMNLFTENNVSIIYWEASG